jgi:nucleoside-diphosphate-sugar epimerase
MLWKDSLLRVLVAGGAGYIGSVLVPLLQEQGYTVDVADLLWFGSHLPEVTVVIQKDLFRLEQADLAGYDQIVFLAGLSNDPMAEYSPAMNFIQNGALPAYLAFQAKQAGVKRFVYASSCSVYGYTVNELYDEGSPVTCAYPYGNSKLAGEHGVLQLQDERFSTIALRQGTVCGHSPRMRFDLIVNTMFRSAVLDGEITVNNPAIWRPIIDVRDVAGAFLGAVQAASNIGGVFNVAKDNYTVGEVAGEVKKEVEAVTGKAIRLQIRDVQDFRNYKVDCARARTVLGFQPGHSIAATVRDLYANYSSYGDLRQQAYSNIEVFKRLDFGEGG